MLREDDSNAIEIFSEITRIDLLALAIMRNCIMVMFGNISLLRVD